MEDGRWDENTGPTAWSVCAVQWGWCEGHTLPPPEGPELGRGLVEVKRGPQTRLEEEYLQNFERIKTQIFNEHCYMPGIP